MNAPNPIDIGFGVSVVCWAGAFLQFVVVMVSSWRRSRRGAA